MAASAPELSATAGTSGSTPWKTIEVLNAATPTRIFIGPRGDTYCAAMGVAPISDFH